MPALYNAQMPLALLATKLIPPPLRPAQVERTRLLDDLDRGLRPGHKITVVTAPAGSGKTTLLSAWVLRRAQPAAWLALEAADNDPVRFVRYVIAALQTVDATLGAESLSLLEEGQPPLGGSIWASLVNDVTTAVGALTLILDDYHLIEHPPIHAAIAFLLDHLPPGVHLVLASRAEPPLPLARLRARGELIELRAADLRFSPGEAADFLEQVMGLSLSAGDVVTLEDRTEGWVAGLQLAALSLRGRQDTSAYIQSFGGDQRHIADYLVEEVLQRQPDSVRRFLLETSILDRLNGALCEAVTGQTDAGARLLALERANLFVIPLDDRRDWYRYHPLFADVLRARLQMEQPADIAPLHQRASAWHAQQGWVADAIDHALAAADDARAAELIEGAVPAMRRTRQEAVLLGWFRALPDPVLDLRPVLSAHYAAVLLLNGELEGVEARLRAAERWLAEPARDPNASSASAAGPVIVDAAEYRRLPGSIAAFRAALSLRQGALADAADYADRALAHVADDDPLGQGAAGGLLGLARWARGDLAGAQQAYADGIAALQRAGHWSDALGCTLAVADMLIAQGRLPEAQRTFEQALELGRTPLGRAVRGTADMQVGLSELYRERNDLKAALECLEAARALGEQAGLPQHAYRWRVALGRIRQVQGAFEEADALLAEAERRYAGDLSPNVRPVSAVRARLWVAGGRLSEAVDWAGAHGLTTDDDLTYLREFDHLTLVRVLLAQHRHNRRPLQAVLGLAERLGRAAEAGGRLGSLIESLMLQALAHQALEEQPKAVTALAQALSRAEPAGYCRLFLDEGAPMVGLLRAMGPTQSDYAGRLLAAMETHQPAAARASFRAGTLPVADLVEPLSERERQVLRLLRTELSGPEIARELDITINTFNTHTRNIYGKLGVTNRRAAVRRAEQLSLTL